MTKQFINEYDVLIQGKTIHRLGKYVASQAAEHASQGIWGKNKFLSVRSSNVETAQLAWRLGYAHQASKSIREQESIWLKLIG